MRFIKYDKPLKKYSNHKNSYEQRINDGKLYKKKSIIKQVSIPEKLLNNFTDFIKIEQEYLIKEMELWKELNKNILFQTNFKEIESTNPKYVEKLFDKIINKL